jgi:cation transport ATPase
VLVIATPCPLLIGIPVAIIGSISQAARHSIIIRDPSLLEKISNCQTVIFDKTGTLTYGAPKLVEICVHETFSKETVLQLMASLEQYSKHPLASAVIQAARESKIDLQVADRVEEPPGRGLRGMVSGRAVRVTSRKALQLEQPQVRGILPPSAGGLECVVLIDDQYAATCQFRDAPRPEGAAFVSHLSPKHGIKHILLLSGDRRSEVEYLGGQVGISELYASKSPEEKLAIVREESKQNPTIYVGDGINDAPAMTAATVGVAMGQNSDVTMEAAGAVILDNRLSRVDELLHIGRRMRQIALQSAVGGMTLSVLGMCLAMSGHLSPVLGAVLQEVIDVVAVLNALRTSWPGKSLTDFTFDE